MITLLHGDAREMLTTLPDQSVQMVVTSPPYYGLRKYSDDPREIGQEATPALYVAALVAVFAECWRVLRNDGTLWVNLGDSYAGSWGNYGTRDGKQRGERASAEWVRPAYDGDQGFTGKPGTARVKGLADKNLIGIPWRVAFALQDAGWILRSDCIWNKPNCMPESVTDRPTRAHEYLFLFAKQARYFYDAAAIAEPHASSEEKFRREATRYKENGKHLATQHSPKAGNRTAGDDSRFSGGQNPAGRNKRTVWTIATRAYSEAHFATMPEALIEPCILAGSSAQACETCGAAWGRVVERESNTPTDAPTSHRANRIKADVVNGISTVRSESNANSRPPRNAGTTVSTLGFVPRCQCAVNTGSAASVVLDPFGGAGTVAKVAERFQRNAILIDLNQAYIELQERRTDGVQVELFV